jgi:replication-associated recombination protein RarA
MKMSEYIRYLGDGNEIVLNINKYTNHAVMKLLTRTLFLIRKNISINNVTKINTIKAILIKPCKADRRKSKSSLEVLANFGNLILYFSQQ